MKVEKRIFKTELRKTEAEKDCRNIAGYGSVFGTESEDLGGFREIIAEGAFNDVLKDDVRALFNHDSNLILGRTTASTLKLMIDENGLGYEVDMPNTSYANDLLISIERGDVTQSSFAFTVEDDEWLERDGKIIRVVNKVARLYDVSPVTYPAYPDATVAARSLETYLHKVQCRSAREKVLSRIKTPSWSSI